jgi:ribosomal-protein-alanine N-acetyltransferase
MAYIIRPMKLQDIPQVVQIEHEAFPSPWSATNFRYDLLFNRAAQYLVAYRELSEIERRESWLKGLISHLFSKNEEQLILGYAGLWFMADDAHLVNIAVREGYRRQGIGEHLLISAIDIAMERNASVITLEVRPSNKVAQALYRKYGFIEVGVRRGYYYDTKEDALLMSIEKISSASFQSRFERLKQAYAYKIGQGKT